MTMHHKPQCKLQKLSTTTTIGKPFCGNSSNYQYHHKHHCNHNYYHRHQYNYIWISRLFVLIALIVMINDKCLVIGAPAKLDSVGSDENVTGKSRKYTELPDYILSLNDPNIGGAVEYVFILDDGGTKSIAWDLLPPILECIDHETRSISNKNQHQHDNHHRNYDTGISSITTDYSPNAVTAATAAVTTSTSTSTTTTTPSTRTPILHTTLHVKTASSPSISTTPPVSVSTSTYKYTDELLKLPGGNSKTLPSWLVGIDDPDLDVAVPYEVPTDLFSYKPTIEIDLVPPLEPYTDLSEPLYTTTVSKLLPNANVANHFKIAKPFISTTTSTTRSPTTAISYKVHWSQTKPYATSTTTVSPKSRITTTTTPLKTPSHILRRTGTGTTSNSELHIADSVHHTTKSFNNYTPRSITGTSTTTTIIPTTTKTTSTIKPKTTSTPTSTTTTTTRTISKNSGTTVRPLTTSSTIAPELNGNPFEPTIPPWLKDFDYPDVGPGVPYVYDPTADDEHSDHTALASETQSHRVIPSIVSRNSDNTKKVLSPNQSNVVIPNPTLQQPIDVNYEKFPPYFNVSTSYDVPLIPTKTAYSKTNDEKFLGSNQLTNGVTSGGSFATSQQSTNSQGNVSGRFGGPPGVLAPRGDNTPKLGSSVLQKDISVAQHSAKSSTNHEEPYRNMHKILGIFGAPPGILTPYDNNGKSKY